MLSCARRDGSEELTLRIDHFVSSYAGATLAGAAPARARDVGPAQRDMSKSESCQPLGVRRARACPPQPLCAGEGGRSPHDQTPRPQRLRGLAR